VNKIFGVLVLSATVGCPHSTTHTTPTTVGALPSQRPIAEIVYDGTLGSGWEESGWSTRDSGHGPASIDFSKQSAWMLSKPSLSGRFGGLVLRVKPPSGEAEFLEIRLDSRDKTIFPRVKVRADQKADVGDGWSEVFVGIGELDPNNAPFDRIVLRAFRDLPSERVLIDKVALVMAGPDGGVPPPSNIPAVTASFRVDCRAHAKAISPLVYGIAWEARAKGPPNVFATTRRWGGNPTSRFNWQLGNAWNTGSDWFFENVSVRPFSEFLAENEARGMTSAITVPTLGWVAKDTSSYSFPVSVFGAQQRTDEYRSDAGNGLKADGKPIVSTSPERTSLRVTPEFDQRWLESLEKSGKKFDIVILDNEPGIWNETHRDVHPEPTTYDEQLDRIVHYAAAVRRAAPNAKIAGPAEWGWTGYFYSAKDKKAGFHLKPDRRAHGDEPLVPWLLSHVKAESDRTGVKLLDLLDLHFYPQAQNVYSAVADRKTAALRINQVRGLWDKSYTDESWIGEPIYLLPRMRDWIDKSYPGLGIMIGEWSFGGEAHMSGGLATAEALGRFGQFGVTAAYYWTVPPEGSPTAAAFEAYQRFEKYSLPAQSGDATKTVTSIFASRDKTGRHVVLIALNLSPDAAVSGDVDVSSCGPSVQASASTYTGDVFRGEPASLTGGRVKVTLPAYSMTVVDLHLDAPIGVDVVE
jgi:Glycoside hydrolase family 44